VGKSGNTTPIIAKAIANSPSIAQISFI